MLGTFAGGELASALGKSALLVDSALVKALVVPTPCRIVCALHRHSTPNAIAERRFMDEALPPELVSYTKRRSRGGRYMNPG